MAAAIPWKSSRRPNAFVSFSSPIRSTMRIDRREAKHATKIRDELQQVTIRLDPEGGWWRGRAVLGRAIAQAVSRWLPTAAARARSQVRSCGICGGQSSTGAGFLRVLRFPLPILIPPTAPQSSSIIRGWYNRPTVADVPSGLSLTPPRES
jgi:hypothetical protein